jgi:hypothetical protein
VTQLRLMKHLNWIVDVSLFLRNGNLKLLGKWLRTHTSNRGHKFVVKPGFVQDSYRPIL